MTEDIRKCITNYLPKETTYLGEFLFLMPDTVWEGESGGQSFVAVAEDRWPYDSGGLFLAVTEDGSVYKGDLADQSLIQYCAARRRKKFSVRRSPGLIPPHYRMMGHSGVSGQKRLAMAFDIRFMESDNSVFNILFQVGHYD